MGKWARVVAVAAAVAVGLEGVNGDVYMHNPRGSNNRNCNSNSNSRDVRNNNRLFDSQNNDAGGYSCPRAYPFDCYKHTNDDGARAACNALNTGLSESQIKAAINRDGELVHPQAINTPKMMYYSGSVLPIEFTVQHGLGNDKVHGEVVLQAQCETDSPSKFTFTDDCGTGLECGPRDGTTYNNQETTNTNTIPENPDAQDNYNYGRHESYQYYKFCRNVRRNEGLFIADQNLNGNSARYTRQNNNGQRYGFECPEESEYYPYWNPSPWVDIAIITGDMGRCESMRGKSQNVADRHYCHCPSCTGEGQLPNNKRDCEEENGEWKVFPSWDRQWGGVPAPECVPAPFSRDNHLGNVGGFGQPNAFNWTIPSYFEGRKNCVLRMRYNISTADFRDVSLFGDSRLNGEASPLKDRNNNPEDVYYKVDNLCTTSNCRLGLAINTNQFGRTFQDRSYTFEVRKPPADADCDKIYNLNVRGKRGNIVQAYPSVEYDFVPNKLIVTEDDCVHTQWTGSDYNPNRNPNNAEGGPPNPNNLNEAKTDRSNIVQMRSEQDNMMMTNADDFNMFVGGKALFKKLAFLDQPVESQESCLSRGVLATIHGQNNNNAIDRDYRNCMKLSGQKTPYFNAGLLKSEQGIYDYMSTRNNNFSNRGQKGRLIVIAGSGLSAGAIVGIVFGSLVFVGLGAFAFLVFLPNRKKRKQEEMIKKFSNPTAQPAQTKPSPAVAAAPVPMMPVGAAAAAPSHSQTIATALYDHDADEAGEISFRVGDRITVLKQDPSGWWEGRTASGVVGVFPSNYVSLSPPGATLAAV